MCMCTLTRTLSGSVGVHKHIRAYKCWILTYDRRFKVVPVHYQSQLDFDPKSKTGEMSKCHIFLEGGVALPNLYAIQISLFQKSIHLVSLHFVWAGTNKRVLLKKSSQH